MSNLLGAGSADKVQGRMSGTFDLDELLQKDSVIVAVVVSTVDGVNFRTNKRTGDNIVTCVLGVDQFGVVTNPDTRDALLRELMLDESQFGLPFAAEEEEPLALTVSVDSHEGEHYVDPDEGEVYSPGATRAPVTAKRDPVLAQFLAGGT